MMHENLPSKKLADITDSELIQRLNSSQERDWSVGEYREVARRGSTILKGYPLLEKKYINYEIQLKRQLEILKNNLNLSNNFVALSRIENQFLAINKPILTPLAINPEIVEAIRSQAKNIQSFVNNSLFRDALGSNDSAFELVRKQARDISNLVNEATRIASPQSTLSQIQLSAQLVDSATRSAGILSKIPNQLSLSQESYLSKSNERPSSAIPESLDSYDLDEMLASSGYEDTVKMQLFRNNIEVVEVSTLLVDTMNRIGTELSRMSDSQEKANEIVQRTIPSKYWVIGGTIIAAISVLLAIYATFI